MENRRINRRVLREVKRAFTPQCRLGRKSPGLQSNSQKDSGLPVESNSPAGGILCLARMGLNLYLLQAQSLAVSSPWEV